MPKPTGLPSLNLNASKNNAHVAAAPATATTLSPHSLHSPREPHSPRSAPTSPRLQTAPASMMQPTANNEPTSPRITAVPDMPPSPSSPKDIQHTRDPSKSFFSNLMASKSSHKLNASQQSLDEKTESKNARSRANSKDRSLHTIKKQGSTPELPRYQNGNGNAPHPSHEHSNSASAVEQMPPPKQKGKSKLGGILTRTKTLKLDDGSKVRQSPADGQFHLETHADGNNRQAYDQPLKTAPIRSDHREKAFANSSNSSTPRNRSADRQGRNESANRYQQQPPNQNQNIPPSHSFRDGAAMQLLSNIGHQGRGVGDRLGKAGKGFFGRMARSGSSNEREVVTDDTYVCSTINLPLIKQTRKTRIARRLELSKDKTEFWMPALPWRCIEYVDTPSMSRNY
jgi:hypothetical protein